jgi:hypothetical protein
MWMSVSPWYPGCADSEDCLTLDVYVPPPKLKSALSPSVPEPVPVMAGGPLKTTTRRQNGVGLTF